MAETSPIPLTSPRPDRASQEPFPSKWVSWAVVLVLTGWLAFGGIGTRDIIAKAEARVAQTAQEMLRSGDWVLPTFGGEARLEKPPLMYWLVVAASQPWGRVTETSAMIPVALATLGLSLVLMAWGTRLGGPLAGLSAAVIVATMPGIFDKAHSVEMALPLVFFVTLGMWVLAGRIEGWNSSPWALVGGHLALALGFLIKGPPALIFPVVTFTALWLAGRRWPALRGERRVHMWLGILLSAALIAPWVLAVSARHPEALQVWWEEGVTDRVSEGRVHHSRSLFYYFRGILPVMLPWVLLVPLAWRPLSAVPEGESSRNSAAGHEGASRRQGALLLAWAAGSFLVFSLVGGKRWYYLLPILPPVALAAGVGLAHWVRGAEGREGLWGRWVLAGLGLALGAGGIGLPVVGAVQGLPLLWPVVWGALTVALGVAAFSAVRRGARRTAALTTLLAGVTLCTAVRHVIWPHENLVESPRAYSTWVRETVPPGEMIYLVGSNLAEMRFYLDRPVREIRAEEMRAVAAARGASASAPVWALIKEEDLGDLTGVKCQRVQPPRPDLWPGQDPLALLQVTGTG